MNETKGRETPSVREGTFDACAVEEKREGGRRRNGEGLWTLEIVVDRTSLLSAFRVFLPWARRMAFGKGRRERFSFLVASIQYSLVILRTLADNDYRYCCNSQTRAKTSRLDLIYCFLHARDIVIDFSGSYTVFYTLVHSDRLSGSVGVSPRPPIVVVSSNRWLFSSGAYCSRFHAKSGQVFRRKKTQRSEKTWSCAKTSL